MSGWKILAQIAAFFAVICALLWLASRRGEAPKNPNAGMKPLSGTVAEGLVYWSPKEPFPRASCDACRVGKVKAGVFSLGAFSTIEFDNLVINIPPSPNGDDSQDSGDAIAGDDGAKDVVDELGLRPLAAMARGGVKGKFFGIKVNGLSLGRMVGGELKPVAKAKSLRNSKRKILIEGMRVFEDGGEKDVLIAELVTKPTLAIVWSGGRIELSRLRALVPQK